MTSTYLKSDTKLSDYMAFPRFLLNSGLNETAMLLYVLLLDRARLSMNYPQWIDEKKRVFLHFQIRELATVLHKSEMTVKTTLSALQKQDLIIRERQGLGKPNRIYVLLPEDKNLSGPGEENCPSDRQNSFGLTDRKLSGNNKNYRKKQINKYSRDYDCKEYDSL